MFSQRDEGSCRSGWVIEVGCRKSVIEGENGSLFDLFG